MRRWWLRRADLNEEWTLVVPPSISKEQFQRLIILVVLTSLIYLPYSLYILIHLVTVVSFGEFSWDTVHRSDWGIIVRFAQPTAPATSWIGIILSATSVIQVAIYTRTKKRCTSCLDWIDNRLSFMSSKFNLHEKEHAAPDNEMYPALHTHI